MSTTNTERTFVSVLSKLGGAEGAIKYVRPSELAKEGFTGIVAQGFYEGATPNNLDKNKFDYKVRTEAGDLIVLNSTGSLAKQMSIVDIGAYIRVNYNGMTELTKGKLKGKSVHNYEVEIG